MAGSQRPGPPATAPKTGQAQGDAPAPEDGRVRASVCRRPRGCSRGRTVPSKANEAPGTGAQEAGERRGGPPGLVPRHRWALRSARAPHAPPCVPPALHPCPTPTLPHMANRGSNSAAAASDAASGRWSTRRPGSGSCPSNPLFELREYTGQTWAEASQTPAGIRGARLADGACPRKHCTRRRSHPGSAGPGH